MKMDYEYSSDTRSTPGEGEMVQIYVLGSKAEFADDVLGAKGDTCMVSSRGEDYARCGWSVVVKAKIGVSDKELSGHLRDLADAIDDEEFGFVPHDDELPI